MFSGFRKNSQHSGPPLSGKLSKSGFSLERWAIAGVWIYLSPMKTNDGLYLSHIPIPARGKDKKGTAARHLHAGCTSIRDVIVMLN